MIFDDSCGIFTDLNGDSRQLNQEKLGFQVFKQQETLGFQHFSVECKLTNMAFLDFLVSDRHPTL